MHSQNEYLSTPFLLIYIRLVLGFVIPTILLLECPNAHIYSTILITIGLLTDVFDGIIARRLGISSERLRIWDSNVDQFFWLAILGTVFYINFTSISPYLYHICIILVLEIIAYIASYLKFKKAIATHSILAKIWTISLLIWTIEMILYKTNYSFPICFWLGLISRIEIILIIATLKKWATDVPSLLVVHDMNSGKKIKKNKWFNG